MARAEQNLAHSMWAEVHGKQSADDAFSCGEFKCEADLDRSSLMQREKKTCFGRIDFTDFKDEGGWRKCRDVRIVNLLGGPYHGREALVRAEQQRAFVIVDWEYRQRENNPDVWYWWYDEFS